MQVSPSQAPTTASFDEFLNLDLTSGDSSSQHDPLQDLFSPRLSESSPSSAATFLPPTPPQQMQSQTALDTLNPNHLVFNELYRTYIEPLKSRHDFGGSSAAGPSTLGEGAFPFGDLFASYANEPLFQPLTSAAPGVLPYTIDPSLMATPAIGSVASPIQSPMIDPPAVASSSLPTKSTAAKSTKVSMTVPRASTASVMGDDEDDEDDDDEDDDDEPTTKGGKAKSKKVGVATGGIVKRTGPTSCVVRDPDSNDPEDWRPTPEEYKKLSSKEKRQLRNKISARNFRVRRKEYITTLEGQISDRDKLISAIRDELGIQKLENAELRQEIDNLKKAMLDGRAPPPTGLPPPSATTNISVDSSPAPATRRTLTKANPNKDVSASGSGFWGGAVGMGGVTSVHATMIPDMTVLPPGPTSLTSVLAGKARSSGWVPMATATLGTLPGHAHKAGGDNINPNLNNIPRSPSLTSGSSSESESSSSSSSATSPLHTPPQSPPNLASLQQWNDINPFTIKTLDSYRLQLWGKMAAAGHLSGIPPAPPQPTPQSLFHTYSASGSSLANNLRPAFFTTPTSTPPVKQEKAGSPSLSAVLAGKTVASLSSGSSTKPAPVPQPQQQQQQQIQLAAALASQSIVSRMGSAFWDAFAGSSPSSSSSSSTSYKTWDTDKIRKVLEGKAVLKVVDIEPIRAKSVDTSLEEKFKGLNLTSGLSREERELLVEGGINNVASPAASRPGLFKNLLK